MKFSFLPKIIHCDIVSEFDLMGRPAFQIKITKAFDPDNGNQFAYTVLPRVENNNKSAVGECMFIFSENNMGDHTIDNLHKAAEESFVWFQNELNARIGMPLLQHVYDRQEMDSIIREGYQQKS